AASVAATAALRNERFMLSPLLHSTGTLLSVGTRAYNSLQEISLRCLNPDVCTQPPPVAFEQKISIRLIAFASCHALQGKALEEESDAYGAGHWTRGISHRFGHGDSLPRRRPRRLVAVWLGRHRIRRPLGA